MYFAKKNLSVIQFMRHTTPFYNFKTKISKSNEKVNQSECQQCFLLLFLNFEVPGIKNSQDDISHANKIANTTMSVKNAINKTLSF